MAMLLPAHCADSLGCRREPWLIWRLVSNADDHQPRLFTSFAGKGIILESRNAYTLASPDATIRRGKPPYGPAVRFGSHGQVGEGQGGAMKAGQVIYSRPLARERFGDAATG